MSDNRLIIDSGNDTFITDWGQWEWKPQPDITAYELALALPALFYQGWGAGRLIQELPESTQRHFRKIK